MRNYPFFFTRIKISFAENLDLSLFLVCLKVPFVGESWSRLQRSQFKGHVWILSGATSFFLLILSSQSCVTPDHDWNHKRKFVSLVKYLLMFNRVRDTSSIFTHEASEARVGFEPRPPWFKEESNIVAYSIHSRLKIATTYIQRQKLLVWKKCPKK